MVCTACNNTYLRTYIYGTSCSHALCQDCALHMTCCPVAGCKDPGPHVRYVHSLLASEISPQTVADQAKYEERLARGKVRPLPEILAAKEEDPTFAGEQVNNIGPHVWVSLAKQRPTGLAKGYPKPFDRFIMYTQLPNGEGRVAGVGRTIREAAWAFRRQMRSTHLCPVCDRNYWGQSGCAQCALREMTAPQEECGSCKERTPFTYELLCAPKHISAKYCKPCLRKFRALNPDQPPKCPSCRTNIRINQGFKEIAVHEHDDDVSDYDYDEYEMRG